MHSEIRNSDDDRPALGPRIGSPFPEAARRLAPNHWVAVTIASLANIIDHIVRCAEIAEAFERSLHLRDRAHTRAAFSHGQAERPCAIVRRGPSARMNVDS